MRHRNVRRSKPVRAALAATLLSLCASGVLAAPAANDDFADAVDLGSAPETEAVGSNAGAGIEAGEPVHAGNAGGRSVWWRWTAPASGPVLIDTFVSGFDTLLGVYTGARVDALTPVAGNDDAGTRLSRAIFDAVAGETYHVAVDGYEGASGDVRLRIVGPGRAPLRVAADGSADFDTLQGAIDAAADGDTILVAPGIYHEAVDFRGDATSCKDVVLASEHGPEVTIVEPASATSVVTLDGCPETTVLAGFTLRLPAGPVGPSSGGGIAVTGGSRAVVYGNVITQAWAAYGGGIHVHFSAPLIAGNRILGNEATFGGGIYISGATGAAKVLGNEIADSTGAGIMTNAVGFPLIADNWIHGNAGHGVSMINANDATLERNVIVDNAGVGITWGNSGDLRILGNTVAGNGAGLGALRGPVSGTVRIVGNVVQAPGAGSALDCTSGPPDVAALHSNLFHAGAAPAVGVGCETATGIVGLAGNLDADPMFLDAAGGDFRLDAASAGLDAVAPPSTLLFDDLAGTAPDAQPWLLYAALGGTASRTPVAGGVDLITDRAVSAGFSSHVFTFPKNPALPALDDGAGYELQFRLRVNEETHVSSHRAGFSVIVISESLSGIELGFWEDAIWAQSGPDFTRAESVAHDTTAAEVAYRLVIEGATYRLHADGAEILSGPLRDYSVFGYPYNVSGFVFLGDDTGSAAADVTLGRVALVTSGLAAQGGADFDGNPRAVDGDGRGGAEPDAGAYEINPAGVFELTRDVYRSAEGRGSVEVQVARRGGSAGAASVRIESVAGSAGAGSDFTPVSETLDFADGATGPVTVVVPVVVDAHEEPEESFQVRLSEAAGGALLGRRHKAAVVIEPGFPDLVLDAVASPATATAIDTVEVTYSVTNAGGRAAPGVTLRGAIGAAADALSFTASQGSCAVAASGAASGAGSGAGSGTDAGERRLECDLGTLAVDGAATVVLRYVPGASGRIDNAASVATTGDERNGDDNAASAPITVTPQARLLDYLPLVEGTVVAFDGPHGIVVREVLAPVALNGVQVFPVRDRDGGAIDTSYLSNDADGLRLHRVDGYEPADRTTSSVVLSPPILLAPAELTDTQPRSQSGTATFTIPGSGSVALGYQSTVTPAFDQSVTVPAGTFATLRLVLSTRFHGTVQGQLFDETEVDTMWLAKGLGPVRESATLDGATDTFELIGRPPTLTAPAPQTTLTSTAAAFSWDGGGTPVQSWGVYVGTAPGARDVADSGVLPGSAAAFEVAALPDDGEALHVRLFFRIAGGWYWRDYRYTAPDLPDPSLTSPAPAAALSGPAVRFDWTANGNAVDAWRLQLGSTAGARDHFDTGVLGAAQTTASTTSVPQVGEAVHARLYWRKRGVWQWADTQYATPDLRPSLESPGPGSVLVATTATFTWDDHGTAVEDRAVWFGSTPGGRQYGHAWAQEVDPADPAGVPALTFTALPHGGETVHATFWWKVRGTWSSRRYVYTAVTLPDPVLTGPESTGDGDAAITAPEPLDGAVATFTWDDHGIPVQDHALWFGTRPGGREYGYAWARDVSPQDPSSVTSLTFGRLPFKGETVHVTFWWKVRGVWRSRAYTYTAVTLPDPELTGSESTGDADAAITTPEPLDGAVATFTWDDHGVPVEDHAVWFGRAPGRLDYGYAWARDVDPQSPASVTSLTFAGLPFRGETVHVTFWWKVHGAWRSRGYVYTAATLADPALSPGAGTVLGGASQRFTWDDHGVPTQDHAIWFGRVPGGREHGYVWARDAAPDDPASVSELTFTRLPTDGSTVHVTFWWMVRGRWSSERLTMQAAGGR